MQLLRRAACRICNLGARVRLGVRAWAEAQEKVSGPLKQRGFIRISGRWLPIGGSSFTPQQLFADNETGAHFETYDPNTLLRRRNQFTFTEFPSGTSNLTTASSLVTNSSLTGYDGAIAIGWDGVNDQDAYKSPGAGWAGATVIVSVIVKMDDGGAPSFGSAAAANAANDFFFAVGSATNNGNPLLYQVTSLGGGFYRVTSNAIAASTSASAWGIRKRAGNSNRTFKTTAWHFEPNVSSFSSYQKVTDWNTEYKDAALNRIGMWQERDAVTPVTAVEQPVGFWMDWRLGSTVTPGSDLVDTANTAAAWTQLTGTPTIAQDGDAVKVTGTGAAQVARLALDAAGGLTTDLDTTKLYRITFDAKVSSGASVVYSEHGQTLGGFSQTVTSTSYVSFHSYVQESTTLDLRITVDNAEEAWIKNIKVHEIGVNNRALQATSGARPTLSARYNLLLVTEQFDSATWSKDSVASTSANTSDTTDPNGRNTAEKVTFNAGGRLTQSVTIISGATTRHVLHVKKGNRQYAYLGGSALVNSFANGALARFDLDAGTLHSTTTAGTGYAISGTPTITSLGSGWYRLAVDIATTGVTAITSYIASSASAAGTSADASAEVYLWGADLRYAVDGNLNQPAYQRVNTSTDYDTDGFIHYLKFDGTDDFLATPAVNINSQQLAMFAGVTKLAESAAAVVVESAAGYNTTGGYAIFAPGDTASPSYSVGAGSNAGDFGRVRYLTFAAPTSNVVTGILDGTKTTVASGCITGRVNGAAATSVTVSDSFVGATFGNHVINIGRRNGTSLALNGRLTSLTLRGTTTRTSERFIRDMEQYAARLAGQSFAST